MTVSSKRRGLPQEIGRTLSKVTQGVPFTPPFITFFVTNKCDCRCEHCFYWEDLNTNNDKELKLEQIQEMSRNMDDIIYLLIGGGEPFLRADLADIIETFYNNNNLHSLVIPTNGQWPERILETVDRVMTNCPELQFSVTISLDAIGDLYDKIRGKQNAYERAMITHEGLKELRAKHERFSVRMCQTIMQQNQHVAMDTYEYQKEYLKPDMINVIYIRGNPLVSDSKNFDMDVYRQVKERMAQDMKNGTWVNHKPTDRGRHALNALDDVVHDLIYKTERDQKAQLTCQAGRISAVIYPDGSLVECETKNTPYGNLKDVDMNFRKLWFTEKGKTICEKAQNGCFCTHESSCFYPSLFFAPKLLPTMLKHTVKHQFYDLKNRVTRKIDKIANTISAFEAPGYKQYEAGLKFSVRKSKAIAKGALDSAKEVAREVGDMATTATSSSANNAAVVATAS